MAYKRNDISGSLFDNMLDRLDLKNDAALARFLQVPPAIISKVRNGRLPIGPAMIINVHERTMWPVAEIKAMLPAEPAKQSA